MGGLRETRAWPLLVKTELLTSGSSRGVSEKKEMKEDEEDKEEEST